MIIGLSGYARSGKDTVAGILTTHAGYERRGFADIMKRALWELNPLLDTRPGWRLQQVVRDVDDTETWDKAKVEYPELRPLLQRLGTDVGRELFGVNFWVDQATKDIHPLHRVVFSDCRFENEAQRVKELGGEVWRVTRPGVTPANSHISEIGLDHWQFDQVIVNDGSIEDLVSKVSYLAPIPYAIERTAA